MEISLAPRSVFVVLLGVIGTLAAADAALLAYRFGTGLTPPSLLVHWFNLDGEQNLPSLFSTTDLGLSAALLASLSCESRQRRPDETGFWRGLVAIFLFLAVDEFCGVHEHLIQPMHQLLPVGGVLTYAWVIPYGAFVLVFAAAYLRFWWRLPAHQRTLFALAGVIYVTGAAGLELLGGLLKANGLSDSLAGGLEVLCEESMEMGGIALFVFALLELHAVRGITFSVGYRN